MLPSYSGIVKYFMLKINISFSKNESTGHQLICWRLLLKRFSAYGPVLIAFFVIFVRRVLVIDDRKVTLNPIRQFVIIIVVCPNLR